MSGHVPGFTVRPAQHLVRRIGPAYEPGTVRYTDYRRRGPDGKPRTEVWPSIAEQVAEATQAIRESLAGAKHEPLELFTFAEHCGHTDPDEDEKYEGVDDLVDDWLLKNCCIEPGWPNWSGDQSVAERNARLSVRSKNYDRAIASIPLAARWRREREAYHDSHSNVCLDSPVGTFCAGCSEDDDIDPDFGVEAGTCLRQERAKERQDEFWALFSEGEQ